MSIQASTKEPVTTSGWYERTDGTVTRYDWRDGVLIEGATVASFADVPEVDHAADDRASRASTKTKIIIELEVEGDAAMAAVSAALDAGILQETIDEYDPGAVSVVSAVTRYADE